MPTPTTAASTAPKINFVREEVTALKPRWDLIRDCLSGEKAVKDKRTAYLPAPNASDTSAENAARYLAYLCRAVFYAVTGRTLRGLLGQVFARDPQLELPSPVMDLMTRDVDGGGVTLDQQARKTLSHVVAHGRCGILTDYPILAVPATQAQVLAGEVKPTITLFDPWDIINWRVALVRGKRILTLVVISEKEVTDDDGFEQKWDSYFRVLRLLDGVYHSQIWFFDDKINDFVMESDVIPVDGGGKPWQEIPFTFVGPENNDPTPDLPPLYDLASLNIAHYRNSADFEEVVYIVGQPTPVFAGLTESWVKEVLKGTVQLGARGAVLLPEQGSASLLQVAPNTAAFDAMEHKERQMVALGAELVQQTVVQRTATEAGAEQSAKTSLLANCAKNVSSAYTDALRWAARFLAIEVKDGEDSNCVYELNTEFDLSKLDAQGIAQIIASWQANAITFEEMRGNLKSGGVAWEDDEEAKAKMETTGLDLGVPVGSPASAAAAAAEAKAKADAEAKKQGGGKPPVE